MYRETLQKSAVCQELYASLARTLDTLRRPMEDLLKTYGLSEPQYNVLCILKEAYPQVPSCGEIGARMVTRDPDVTRLLDRLEQAHLVERKRGGTDRRIMYATILPAGLTLLETLERPMAELQERQCAYLAGEETNTLFYHLMQIKQDAGPNSVEVSPSRAPQRSLAGA